MGKIFQFTVETRCYQLINAALVVANLNVGHGLQMPSAESQIFGRLVGRELMAWNCQFLAIYCQTFGQQVDREL